MLLEKNLRGAQHDAKQEGLLRHVDILVFSQHGHTEHDLQARPSEGQLEWGMEGQPTESHSQASVSASHRGSLICKPEAWRFLQKK